MHDPAETAPLEALSPTSPQTVPSQPVRLAVIGAGPAGLTLALLASTRWPEVQVTVFDARAADKDVSADPRTLALSLGSVQLLQQLCTWPAELAQPITQVHVSQAAPNLLRGLLPKLNLPQAEVRIRADEQAVPMLGAVLAYGQLVAPLQAAWAARCAAEPARHRMCFGTPVQALKDVAGGVEVDAGTAETFDLAVVAEGGVFAEQARKAVSRDYQQTAWVGSVTLDGHAPTGAAFERFTRHGPVALLPLKPAADGTARASLVWCVDSRDDPVAPLDATQRRIVLNTLLSDAAGQVLLVGPLKSFALGLNAERGLVTGRQVRIGNAAQTLHPVAGQGLNLGLRDAWSLVHTLRGAADLDAALRRVAWARAPDRWSMIAATDFLARSFTWQLPGLATARGLGLAALQALPPIKSALARQMMFGRR
ncbi:FAD-dependent monooxygenase [Ideonella azotifigens]|uniref:UbiH/UbiF/VisC/COQ6 family ubiquinone biosynthesis hydroxylase n=2 Tax=Ideonella azotifigens TaxID=513160 RepID=A0ABN1JMM8_9BURK|nr:FAD-dependent monooxygenase [Ideonella azotifigens]MCD2339715.1 FAD-dependent monooxygenase [Ideonella azotifigens]